jgi:NitT/TauT family transport system substrate-binding protein
MKFNWKQFGIALCLFLAGYLTFNSDLFAQPPEKTSQRVVNCV